MCDSIWVSLHFSLDGRILGYPLYRARTFRTEHEFEFGTNHERRDDRLLRPDGLTRPARRALRGTLGRRGGVATGTADCDSGVSMITNHVMSRVGDGVAALWLSSHVTDTR